MCCFSGDSGFPFGAALTLEAVFFFFFFFTMEKMIWLSYGGVSPEVLGKRLSGGRRRWRSTTARLTPSVRESPIFIPSSLTIPVAHAYAKTHTHTCKRAQAYCSMAGALLLPQSMEYHICLFTPRFLSLNSINIYIAAEGVGSPSCSGGNSA